MNVRNFYTSTKVDGRATTLEGGPASKDGGFETTIKVRLNGSPHTAIKVNGWATKSAEGIDILVITIGADAGEGDGMKEIDRLLFER